MSEEQTIQIDKDYVIASLSRQVAEQAQRIALLEAVIRQAGTPSEKQEDGLILPNG